MAVTFLDLPKAFDTVNHELLLEKLYSYGIQGNVHDLLVSYPNNRYQRVKINDVSSEMGKVKTAVSQVTVLGPLLFLLYINDYHYYYYNYYQKTLYYLLLMTLLFSFMDTRGVK